MARGNAVLQKKLAELESEIGRLLEHPSSYIHDDIDGQVGFYRTARKISFIKNFLKAEMDSHPGGRPEQNHMDMRLSILEKTFVNWAIPANWKQGETVGESTVEVTEDKEEGRERIQGEKVSESKLEINEDEKAEEKQQEAEMVEERKVVVKDGARQRDRDREGKMVEEDKVEATEEKERWKQEGEVVGERKFKSEENKESKRKGALLPKDEKEIKRNHQRRKVGDGIVEVIDDKQEERKDKGEMMRTTLRGRHRKREAEMAGMQKIEVKEDKKGRERKQQSYRIKNCMAMGCAAVAGFAMALIGVAVTNIFSVEETVYLFPT